MQEDEIARIFADLKSKGTAPTIKVDDNVWVSRKKGRQRVEPTQLTFLDPSQNKNYLYQTPKLCHIENCETRTIDKAKYCSKHNHRIKKHGDPARGDRLPTPEEEFYRVPGLQLSDLDPELQELLADLKHFYNRSRDVWYRWEECEVRWQHWRRVAKKHRDYTYPQFRTIYEGVVHYERTRKQENNITNMVRHRGSDFLDKYNNDFDVTVEEGRKLYKLVKSYRIACDKSYSNFQELIHEVYISHIPNRIIAETLDISNVSHVARVLDRTIDDYKERKLRRDYTKTEQSKQYWDWSKGLWWG